MEKIDLSIAIVAYHNEKDIIKAIQSIEKYTTNKLIKKIYIIDNGDTPDAYLEIIKRFSDVIYINSGKNLGFGKGHNYIIETLDSEFHAIVNPDILINEDVFQKILLRLRDNSNTVIIPRVLNEKYEMQPVYRREITVFDMLVRIIFQKMNLFNKRFDTHTMQDKDYSKEFPVPFAQGSFLVMSTSFFKKMEGFDERFFMYLEDADFCKRSNMVGEVIYFPETSVIHKWERGSYKNFKLLKYHLKSLFLYFNKWGYQFK